MRQVLFDRPFIDGVVTDQPAYKLGVRNSRSAKDLVAPRGIATVRRGWTYDLATVSATDLGAVARGDHVLANEIRTVTCRDGVAAMGIRAHNSAGTATSLSFPNWSATVQAILPRCYYRDALVLCNQSGQDPVQFYSGSVVDTATPTTTTMTAGRAIVTATSGTWSGTIKPGMYVNLSAPAGPTDDWVVVLARVVEVNSSTSITVEDVYASAGITHGYVATLKALGQSYPCVEVYDAGTGSMSAASNNFTGVGTKWFSGSAFGSGEWGFVYNSYTTYGNDGLLTKGSDGVSRMWHIGGTGLSDTNINVTNAVDQTNIQYSICRRMPFKDAASHKGSLFGTGVAQHKNRVYVGPPGWNPAIPPGVVPPFDVATLYSSENVNDFLMDYVEVPAAYDGDAIIAIRPSHDPLVVNKRKDAWGIYGAWPVFERTMLPNGAGAGCLDIRSAQSVGIGPVWAGEDDIFVFRSSVEALTEGKINREWRAITADFAFGTDYCAIGESQGHLFVSITSNGGSAHVTKVMDLSTGAWVSNEFTNHKARYFFTSKIDGEEEKFLWVGPDEQGRVMDSSEVIEGGLAKDGDGTSPSFDAYTGEGLDGDEAIDQESRVLDVAISANVYDSASAATDIEVSLISAGSLYAPTAVTTTLGTIESDTVDRPDRTFFDPVDVDGRTHQLRVRTTAIGTNDANTKVEIPELVMTVRDVRGRT